MITYLRNSLDGGTVIIVNLTILKLIECPIQSMFAFVSEGRAYMTMFLLCRILTPLTFLCLCDVMLRRDPQHVVFSLCLQAVYKCLLDRVPEEQKDTNVQ